MSLTPRQTEVLKLLAAGLANKEIASQIGRSVFTVNAHVHTLHRKTRTRWQGRAALVIFAFNNGIVKPKLEGES